LVAVACFLPGRAKDLSARPRMYIHVHVAFGSQHAQRMCRIILSSVACLALQYFPTLSDKWQDFQRGKKIKK